MADSGTATAVDSTKESEMADYKKKEAELDESQGALVGSNREDDPPDYPGEDSIDAETGVSVNHERETFTNKIDFLLACIGYSVGFGNFWRFPYLCYKNGGGAFLIPYFIMVVLAGIPMFFLEVSVGQFMSAGGIKVWRAAPFFEGIGWATTIILFLLNCYYNVILAWGFYYLFASFASEVPWASCGNWWNTPQCRSFGDEATAVVSEDMDMNSTIANVSAAVGGIAGNMADMVNTTVNATKPIYVDSVTEFWQNRVLGLSSGIHDMGTVKWDLCLCLLLSWIVVFSCIIKGVKTSGKVVYVTATAPYLFMVVLLIRGCLLEGSMLGVKHYLIPNVTRLGEMEVWVDAGTQIFFSYSIGIGATTALGSFNKFNHNSYKDTIIFSIVNSGTSFMAGFVIFTVLGHMAHQQNIPIEDVAESGPGLAFIAYPKALATMPIAPLWSILFFIMLILLGLDSEFVAQEGLVAAIVDVFPTYLRKGHRKEIFTGLMCCLCFLVALSMVTNGGLYLFQIFDFYSGSRIILLVACFELIALGWFYGSDRFLDNLEMMYGFRVTTVWKWMWQIVAPIMTFIIFVMNCISYSELQIKFSATRTYTYPSWAISIGWLMASASIIMVPIVMIYKIVMFILSGKATLPWRDFEPWKELNRPLLYQHQMRPGDDPRDLDPNATAENTFLPREILERLNRVKDQSIPMNSAEYFKE